MEPFLLMAIAFVYIDSLRDCFLTLLNEVERYYLKKQGGRYEAF